MVKLGFMIRIYCIIIIIINTKTINIIYIIGILTSLTLKPLINIIYINHHLGATVSTSHLAAR